MTIHKRLAFGALSDAYPGELNLDQIIEHARTEAAVDMSKDDVRHGLNALCNEDAVYCSNVTGPGSPYWKLSAIPDPIPDIGVPEDDPVNHPAHYTEHPSGVECIQITEHMGFCLGNAVKYIWRADLKGNAVEDLEKARWYLDREIARRAEQ
ncbi:DUF3310 domain-containing protein [Williamsia sp.]|uniref:DUF3310 domain-containing protein n=1 Tax=Williamsia sp. TaxID=1872085 RepID=UPI002F94D441